jgi:hypothetical protein
MHFALFFVQPRSRTTQDLLGIPLSGRVFLQVRIGKVRIFRLFFVSAHYRINLSSKIVKPAIWR